MKYITEFFNDKHNFWNTGTIACVIILSTIFILDVITTLIILERGGVEYNQYMIPFVKIPFLFGLIKLIALNLLIFGIKLMYDIIQDKFYTKYNILCIYFVFAVPAGLTLCVVIHNLVVLL